MTPSDLRAAGERLYGGYGWQTKLARALGVDGSTVRRWLSGAVAIPRIAEVAITLLIREHDRGLLGAEPIALPPLTRRPPTAAATDHDRDP